MKELGHDLAAPLWMEVRDGCARFRRGVTADTQSDYTNFCVKCGSDQRDRCDGCGTADYLVPRTPETEDYAEALHRRLSVIRREIRSEIRRSS